MRDDQQAQPDTLLLESVAGLDGRTLEVDAETGATIGRSLACDHVLDAESVSRRHFSITTRSGRWLLTDLGSRHGTTLNGHVLPAGKAAIVSDGDLVGAGACSFRVRVGADRRRRAMTIGPDAHATIERVSPEELEALAGNRLDLLVDCATTIHAAADEASLVTAALAGALDGTGFDHGAILRACDDELRELEIVGQRNRVGDAAPMQGFSQTLIRHAAQGQTARQLASTDVPTSMSIVSMGITAALCTPILLGTTVAAFLYLDTRDRAAAVAPDAAAFCQVVARLAGLAMANLKRLELERRQLVLDAELAAARAAQRLIVPGDAGAMGPIRYAMRMRPGKYVAGDLFEILPLGDDRAAVCIGDVTGEGIGAAVIMAAAQAHLHGALQRTQDPAAAVNEVNRYLAERSSHGRFVSMWVGVLDRAAGRLEFVDAGHGHWLHRPRDEAPRAVEARGGIPAGIDAGFQYEAERLALGPGDRVILYSDGLIEQQSPSGEAFGADRVMSIVASATDAEADVARVLDAFDAFTEGAPLKDDTTVASVELV